MKTYLALLFSLLISQLVASQGYQFLGDYTSNGTPLYLAESDNISYETLQMIDDALPESYPVPQYNPHYISSGYDTDINLKEAAEIWVTFVSEGAGYRNVLGFYTYDINNPPATAPSPEDITIIFPNVSALGSGGGLQTGDKVKIGSFEAGTGIGWMLLANGWRGSQVTAGQWQLYSGNDFNPEADASLRYHNVLLNDDENERVILGFEDIRRDYASCDNDFNDAIFYITANPFKAIKADNYNKIKDHSYVSSANDGGLESNGDLARLIAKRNFDRSKTNNYKNRQNKQIKYAKKSYKSLGAKSGNLDSYFPETGMYGTETTYVSSPEDLLAITNADQIFSIDYYQGTSRVSAALATSTKGGIYNHTKTICDRLNNSQLLDVRTIQLQGHQLVYTQLQRNNGEIEVAVSFSVKQDMNQKTLYSFWNLDQYPQGNYLNFQVWGNTMGQVSTIVNSILDTLQVEAPLGKNQAKDVLPTVFIKNGRYKNGKLHLTIVNKAGASWLTLDGNYKTTEQQTTKNLFLSFDLNGNWEEELVIDAGYMFDIGLSINAENSFQYDAMYLADGPWGVDYNTEVDTVEHFEINAHQNTPEINAYTIERSIAMKGTIKETINVFRNILPGDLLLPVVDYSFVKVAIKNDTPIEVSLVTNTTNNWEERLRYTLLPNTEMNTIYIPFSDFKDHTGKQAAFSELKTVVFSVQGDYSTFSTYTLQINSLALTNERSRSQPNWEEIVLDSNHTQNQVTKETSTDTSVFNYPNPFTAYTTIRFPNASNTINATLSTLNGQVVYQETLQTMGNQKSIRIVASHLANGMYLYKLVDLQNGYTYSGKMIKN